MELEGWFFHLAGFNLIYLQKLAFCFMQTLKNRKLSFAG